MKVMQLTAVGKPLVGRDIDALQPGPGQIVVSVDACGVCRTDLHVVDGDLLDPKLPVVPGHEVVGRIARCGLGVTTLCVGDRVGVPWLGWTCGTCNFCIRGQENLCEQAKFTGYTLDGGFAEEVLADARYCFKLPSELHSVHAAPLMCAGLIGYRSLRFAGDAKDVGLYGFGAAAHIVAQIAIKQGRRVYAFVRPGDIQAMRFAESLGVTWAGPSDATPPARLDAAILFAPVGALVPLALRALRKGGVVVCAGIHMSEIPAFPYHILWGERSIRSVANLTRQDAVEFLHLVGSLAVETSVVEYELTDANRALSDLREGRISGAAVLRVRRP